MAEKKTTEPEAEFSKKGVDISTRIDRLATAASDADEKRLERIRERAYAIWLDEGQSNGRDLEHWQQAEREIDDE